jgi:hypothetical protein
MVRPKKFSQPVSSGGAIFLNQTEDEGTRIQRQFKDQTIWLTQKLIAEHFQVGIPTISEKLKVIFVEKELAQEVTLRKFRRVQTEGERRGAREVDHSRMETILSVGFRARSHRGIGLSRITFPAPWMPILKKPLRNCSRNCLRERRKALSLA